MSDETNVVWKNFELDAGLDKDQEYRKLVQFNYGLICNRLYPGAVCTGYTQKFIEDWKGSNIKKYLVGGILIGPDPKSDGYFHEAIGIAEKDSHSIIAVFDPVQSAPVGGQWRVSCANANDRFSLPDWYVYKTRWYTPINISWSEPYCVFNLQENYHQKQDPKRARPNGVDHATKKRLAAQKNYSWVVQGRL